MRQFVLGCLLIFAAGSLVADETASVRDIVNTENLKGVNTLLWVNLSEVSPEAAVPTPDRNLDFTPATADRGAPNPSLLGDSASKLVEASATQAWFFFYETAFGAIPLKLVVLCDQPERVTPLLKQRFSRKPLKDFLPEVRQEDTYVAVTLKWYPHPPVDEAADADRRWLGVWDAPGLDFGGHGYACIQLRPMRSPLKGAKPRNRKLTEAGSLLKSIICFRAADADASTILLQGRDSVGATRCERLLREVVTEYGLKDQLKLSRSASIVKVVLADSTVLTGIQDDMRPDGGYQLP